MKLELKQLTWWLRCIRKLSILLQLWSGIVVRLPNHAWMLQIVHIISECLIDNLRAVYHVPVVFVPPVGTILHYVLSVFLFLVYKLLHCGTRFVNYRLIYKRRWGCMIRKLRIFENIRRHLWILRNEIWWIQTALVLKLWWSNLFNFEDISTYFFIGWVNIAFNKNFLIQTTAIEYSCRKHTFFAIRYFIFKKTLIPTLNFILIRKFLAGATW